MINSGKARGWRRICSVVASCGISAALLGHADSREIPALQQILTPAGVQVDLPGLRPQVIRLSPAGKLLAVSGQTHELILIDPASGNIVQRVPLPGGESASNSPAKELSRISDPDPEGQVSFTGLVFSPDGKWLFLSDVNGSIKVFAVDPGHCVIGHHSIPLPLTGLPLRQAEIPAGLAVSPDGARLYVALNLSNRLLELEIASGRVLRTFDVGTAPYDVVLAGHAAYVSNWGGRRPDATSLTGPAGHGTKVRVDPVRHIANEGSVSVIDLRSGRSLGEIQVGLHSSALTLSPNGRFLCVANAASDTISVIDTRKNRVAETIPLSLHPGDLFGASPNALSFAPDGKNLYVCNGTQNAVAVVAFHPGESKLAGLIPVGWYPGAIACDGARRSLYVANIKGTIPDAGASPAGKTGYNTHQHRGTLSLVPMPDQTGLGRQTALVLHNYRREAARDALLPARPNTPARPVPERAGEPSVFKHVVYIIKENRTYDQILGDLPEGNGDPELCIFDERFTPNQHKLAREFVLLDNLYCSGEVSADGHNWTDSGFATDYLEKSFAGFPRSYPDGMEEHDVDALAYSPTGFIWDKVLAHGKTLRDYGEFTKGFAGWKNPQGRKNPQFIDFYRDFIDHTGLMKIGCVPSIESLRPYVMSDTIGWNLSVPDILRAERIIQELHRFEAEGKLPEFIIICLPNDHTSGTDPGAPTPAAQVADNDLALGRIVEAFSRSAFWKDTCIFAIEDDPSGGWDHVSGYRTTGYVMSPYTKRRTVVSARYNQLSLLHTMELILGLPPMNQMDASASPMFECFANEPDCTPFDSMPANIPLDQLNPEVRSLRDPVLRRDALASAKLPLGEPDRCPEGLMNRILWHAQKGTEIPYPAWAVTAQDDD
jgi:YVTN family beta-propeller protein